MISSSDFLPVIVVPSFLRIVGASMDDASVEVNPAHFKKTEKADGPCP